VSTSLSVGMVNARSELGAPAGMSSDMLLALSSVRAFGGETKEPTSDLVVPMRADADGTVRSQ
jgi:hypothetical protein